jgi:hypothetical protein
VVFWRQKRKLSHFFYIFRKGKPKPPLTPSLTYCCFYFIFFFFACLIVAEFKLRKFQKKKGVGRVAAPLAVENGNCATSSPWVENDSC